MPETTKNAHKCPEGNTETSGRNRAYCFTSFLSSEPFYDEVKMKYLGYGLETCPTTKKSHWQGFVYFFDKISIKKAQSYLKIGKSHMETMKGDFTDNVNYCSKEQQFTHFGTVPKQGRRVDLDELAAKIKEGKVSVDEITMETPMLFHQYGRTLERLEEITMRSKFRNWMTTCDWIYGPTGCGKSHKAYSNFNPSTHYVYNCDDSGFWNGYTGQEIVIINEFRGQIPYCTLLDLIDKWPKTVKIKGKSPFPFLARHIIITSSLRPEEAYHNLAEHDKLEQLYRRIKITHLHEPFKVKPKNRRGAALTSALLPSHSSSDSPPN